MQLLYSSCTIHTKKKIVSFSRRVYSLFTAKRLKAFWFPFCKNVFSRLISHSPVRDSCLAKMQIEWKVLQKSTFYLEFFSSKISSKIPGTWYLCCRSRAKDSFVANGGNSRFDRRSRQQTRERSRDRFSRRASRARIGENNTLRSDKMQIRRRWKAGMWSSGDV